MTNELKHTVFRPSPNVWYLIGYFSFFLFCFRKQQRSNQKYVHCCVRHTSSSTIQRRAWRGFSLRSLLQLDRKINDIGSCNYDANHRSTDPSQGAHKIMHITLLLWTQKKKNTGGGKKRKSATWQQWFCLCVHFCSATPFFKSHELSILCCECDL